MVRFIIKAISKKKLFIFLKNNFETFKKIMIQSIYVEQSFKKFNLNVELRYVMVTASEPVR